ncbi:MAG: hypothetical protein ACXWYS_06110 [Gaiellaceae bacterium]
MASRKVSAAQAKAARQKKIAIGGAVLLVGIMVIQGPKMLKLVSGGGSETAATAPAPVTPAPVTGAPSPTPVSATTPTTGGTKLVSFETFSTKDPFASQVQPATPSETTTTATSKPATGSSTGSSTGTATGASPATSTPTPFTSGSPSPLGPGTATITVNGKPQIVATSSDFPKGDPTFTLVSVGRGTAEVGIAGGSLKAGGKTFTITTAKPTTLHNTANDKQYTLKLVSTARRAA